MHHFDKFLNINICMSLNTYVFQLQAIPEVSTSCFHIIVSNAYSVTAYCWIIQKCCRYTYWCQVNYDRVYDCFKFLVDSIIFYYNCIYPVRSWIYDNMVFLFPDTFLWVYHIWTRWPLSIIPKTINLIILREQHSKNFMNNLVKITLPSNFNQTRKSLCTLY